MRVDRDILSNHQLEMINGSMGCNPTNIEKLLLTLGNKFNKINKRALVYLC
jgi:hypothetical protein